MSAHVVIPAEPTICMMGYIGVAEFQGTRAMLEAEGIVPANTKSPDGYSDLRWEDGKYRYWMRRQRPDGAKGPRKLFIDVDWWSVRSQLIGGDQIDRVLRRKQQELAEYAYSNSAKGRAEWNRRFNSYAAACSDKNFQAFKALLPGLVKPKRERRAKSAQQTQGVAA